MAYDSHAKVYTSYYANSAGLVGIGTGTVNGNTWTWMVEDKVFGQAFKGRTTVTVKSASQLHGGCRNRGTGTGRRGT